MLVVSVQEQCRPQLSAAAGSEPNQQAEWRRAWVKSHMDAACLRRPSDHSSTASRLHIYLASELRGVRR